MGDPELRSDEKVLVRTPGVYVKSIPFEGILTNKRIILIDRAKNLLPPKEIPLVTIKEIESGENAIRDQIITLSVMAKTGETRQMVLTFSRQAGGNRIKERDAWARIIRENISSSFDQVIRKVIPGPEQAPRRAEVAADQRNEYVRSPPYSSTPYGGRRPAGTGLDDISPVRRSITTRPETTVPQPPAVWRDDGSPESKTLFCSKCGTMVPAESVFCNRCGFPITQIPSVSAPVLTPPVPAVVKPHPVRPIDEEIQSIEPLIEPSMDKVPADALLAAPVTAPQTPSIAWDDKEEPEQGTPAESQSPPAKAAEQGFPSQPPIEKATGTPAPVTSLPTTGDTPLPPKPPRDSSFMPGKEKVLTAAVAVVVILLLAAAALFIYPMLTSGGETTPSGSGDATPTVTSSTIKPSGTIVIKETPAPVIPPKGVYVHINYLGGFKGSYGIPDMMTTVPGNSGDRVWEVENATNSTVQATFEKMDGSSHELLVEIYHDGKTLTRGTTIVGHGSVALSVDIATGIAAAPVTSGGSSTGKQASVAAITNGTAVMTTAPGAVTTTT